MQPSATYPTYDYTTDEAVHAQPPADVEGYERHDHHQHQGSHIVQSASMPLGAGAYPPPAHSDQSHRRDSDPFHNQASQSHGHAGYNHSPPYPPPQNAPGYPPISMSQSHATHHNPYDDPDAPLLPSDGSPYGYAPASSFDAHGNLIAGANGGQIESWPDSHDPHDPHARIIDEDDVDGMTRGRKYEEGYASGEEDGMLPGGWAAPGADEEAGAPGIRYGRIPQRVPRRYKTLKRVELYHGNLVLDCPVPSRLLDRLNDRESREFTHMRYTAATCDPDNFKDERYTLRQVLFDPPRRTELFIVLTMYNEDDELFCRTMHGVMTNIAHLCTRERSKTWGKDGWKKVVVCIVSDGRLKINSRVLSVLAAMGVYQEGVGKNVVNGKPVTAHIYEYTTQLSIDPDLKFKGREKGIMPVQILFCLKERNQKKINSHRWFFNAFGSILQPNVCVLLDVGTMPRSKSIYHLWKAFDINSNVAGACGEIVALKGKLWTGLLNPLVAAQNFEYKMSK